MGLRGSDLDSRAPELSDGLIQAFRKESVAIVDQIAIAVLVSNLLSQQLQRPRRHRACGHVEVRPSARAVPGHHEDIKQPKCRRDSQGKVTGDNPFGVVSEKRRPKLISPWTARRPPGQVLSSGARQAPSPKLEQQLIGNSFFTPPRVFDGQVSNEAPQLYGNQRVCKP